MAQGLLTGARMHPCMAEARVRAYGFTLTRTLHLDGHRSQPRAGARARVAAVCPAHAACGRAGKYTAGGTKAAGPRSAMFSDERLTQVAPLLGLMRDVGSAHGGKTCAQVAINWTICKGALPIPGGRLLVPLLCCRVLR